ncbi:hypothetical protein [Bradyrhizobium sp. JR3.5]
MLPSNFNSRIARHSHDGDPPLTMRAACHFVLLGQCIDIFIEIVGLPFGSGSPGRAKLPCGGQKLPGRLRTVNHKTAMLVAFRPAGS